MNGYGRGILDLPPVVKNIIMITVLMLLAYYAASSVFGIDLNGLLGLYFPASSQFKPLQIVTHMFMHGGLMHIFFLICMHFYIWAHAEKCPGAKTVFYFLYGLRPGGCFYSRNRDFFFSIIT